MCIVCCIEAGCQRLIVTATCNETNQNSKAEAAGTRDGNEESHHEYTGSTAANEPTVNHNHPGLGSQYHELSRHSPHMQHGRNENAAICSAQAAAVDKACYFYLR